MAIFRELIPQEDTGGTGGTPYFKFNVTTTVSNQVFTLPIVEFADFSVNITVYWGDTNSNVITSFDDVDKSHIYSSPGTYEVRILGDLPGFNVNNNSSIRNLITAILDFGDVKLRTLDFFGCSNITSIPANNTMAVGYTGLKNVISFANFMRGTGITSIPSSIFSYSSGANVFSDIFSFTPITSIPSGLFNNNSAAINFSSAFNTCTSLTTYPSTLFDNCINVTNFSGTFRNCRLLTSCLSFTYNTEVTSFDNLYFMSTTTNSLDGNAPTLWSRTPTPSGTAAFRNCIGLDNYASIPSNWK